MKAITLTQPWASLVMDGRKQWETRSWSTRYQGPLAIHAAKEIDEAACRKFGYDPETIPRGAVLGVVQLVQCFEIGDWLIRQQTKKELSCGVWTAGRFAWNLAVGKRFTQPIPARGYQRIWNWEEL
jgi:hypothetical protein